MSPAFSIENLRFSFGETEVLRGIDADIERGALTGILGPNGSGKTTLLRLLSGALKPQSGRVLLEGQDVRDLPERQRARRMAVVPQRSHMAFDFTALDVVLMGRYPYLSRFAGEGEDDVRIARRCMERTGVWHLADRGVNGLSGGEWQRVTIARALAQQTDVLLLDEPISSLDIRHQIEVLEAVRALCDDEGKTVVCVLHDLNLAAQYCDGLMLMHEGRLCAMGEAREVLQADRIAEVYGLPVEVVAHPVTGAVMVVPTYARAGEA